MDPALGSITQRYGLPPYWKRPPGFPTLIHIILEQQVSLASARAAFEKLQDRIGYVTPDRFIRLDDEDLRRAGFSRQKARYCRLLASAILDGHFDLDGLERLDDSKAMAGLCSLTGIGPWTAQTYLLMALRRPDVWPAGDLALQVAIQHVYELEKRPRADETLPYAAAWSPYRSVAARMLWHYYLSQ